MPIVQQQTSNNYFLSIDFILRTILFLIATIIIILQHVFTICKSQYQSIDILISGFFIPSFGMNSWSATGLYVTCWTIIVLYIHTILLVFLDNFPIQFHATTFVIQDIITSIFFLAWTITNIIQLSDCSKRQLALDRNETQQQQQQQQQQFAKPFCDSTSCSIYLAPSIACFLGIILAISLAASAFQKINFYKIPRYIRDHDSNRSPHSSSNNDIYTNKQFDPLPNVDIIDRQQSTESNSNRA